MCPVRSCPPVFTMSTLCCLQTADHLMDRGLSRNRLAPTVTNVSVCARVLSVFPATISHGKYWVCCRCSMLAMWGGGSHDVTYCLSCPQHPGPSLRKHQRVTTRRHWALSAAAPRLLPHVCVVTTWTQPGLFWWKQKRPQSAPWMGWNAQAGVNTEQGTVI